MNFFAYSSIPLHESRHKHYNRSMKYHIQIILLLLWRDGLVRSFCILMLLAALMSFFLGMTVISEQWQTTLAFAAFSMKIISYCVCALTSSNLVYQLKETGEWDLWRSRMNSPMKLVLAMVIPIAAISLLIGAPQAIAAECFVLSILSFFFSLGLASRTQSILASLSVFALGHINMLQMARDTIEHAVITAVQVMLPPIYIGQSALFVYGVMISFLCVLQVKYDCLGR
ncbi:MAG: hypothetical protein ACPGXY_06455 [Alphaproteobacteria bacterium]